MTLHVSSNLFVNQPPGESEKNPGKMKICPGILKINAFLLQGLGWTLQLQCNPGTKDPINLERSEMLLLGGSSQDFVSMVHNHG